SRNSSRSPSSDPPHAPKRPPKSDPSGNTPGGQPGHKGCFRLLKPLDQVDHLVAFVPDCCAHCQASLPDLAAAHDPPPRRHQVVDLPPTLPVTTEYQCHARSCPLCGQRTWATL